MSAPNKTQGRSIPAKPTELHLWEFPESFFVQLAPSLLQGLIQRAAEKVGGWTQLARVLNRVEETVKKYHRRQPFIPLPLLRQLMELVGEEYPWERVEQQVLAYKGGYNATPIRNPQLPILESPELFALMGASHGRRGPI